MSFIKSMNIQKIQSNTSFKSWQREVYKKTQSGMITELKHRNDTWFYRGRFDYDFFPEFLEEFFQNVEKVNTYFYGCSDGSDAYSFMMSMITKLKEKTKKYFRYYICGVYFRNIYEKNRKLKNILAVNKKIVYDIKKNK